VGGITREIYQWCAIALALLALSLAPPARAEGNVALGTEIWRNKGACQGCHGWAGDGHKMDSQLPDGANLRETALDRDALIQTIKCGRPGRGMPAFDKFAYSDGRCYGMTLADLRKDDLTLADPASPLQPREIEAVVDFLTAKVIGQGPMTRAKCVAFWGEEVAVCGTLP
jgi:Cytochrome C oxidase, cbb3-type, subunit III